MTDLAVGARKALERAGAQFGDFRLEDRHNFTVRATDEEIQSVSRVRRRGWNVRAFVDGAWGYASGTRMAVSSVRDGAERAVVIAKAGAAAGVPKSRLRVGKPLRRTATPRIRIDPRDVGLEEKIELALAVSKAQRAEPRIANSIGVVAESDYRFELSNTRGTHVRWREVRVRAAGQSIAAEGDRREFAYDTLDGTGGWELVRGLDPASFGAAIAREAIELLSARKPPSGLQTVITDPDVSGLLAHEVMGHASEGDEIVKRRSFLTEKVGTCVGSPLVTMYDDGAYPGGHGSIPYDAEGTPGRKTKVIDRGVYRGYLHSLETSGSLRAAATGNGRAQDFGRRVWVRMTNTYFAPGRDRRDEMIADTRSGVLTHRAISGMEDPVGGGFQAVTLKGYRIRKGEVAEPLRGMTLTGKALSILKSVDLVSREFALTGGFCGKGEEDYVPVASGGPYMRCKIILGGG